MGKYYTSIARCWLIPIYFAVFCLTVDAQTYSTVHPDSKTSLYTVDVNIFYRYDDNLIDTAYMGNSEVFLMLDSLMKDTAIINHTQTINITTSSSIEGSVAYNTALSQRRMRTVEATLRQRYDYIPNHVWNFSYTPENWVHLRNAVTMDTDVPNREEVLHIIDTDTCELHPDAKEYLLKKLDKGTSWSYIHQRILPSSRGSVSMLLVPTNLFPIARTRATVSVQQIEKRETEQLDTSPPTARYSRPILSIRSNLLLDLSSTLNIGIEVPLSPHWSISAEYINPWWKSWNHALTWQIQSLYFDVRYWFGDRGEYNYLNGWNVGIYAGSGWYDLQPFKETGIQGEYSDYGATLSYAHFLGKSKHWLLEYTVGLGYVTTHYRHYYTAANTDEYGNIKVHNYPWSEETLRAPVPTRLGVTLAYLITVNGLKRKEGKQ